MVTVEEVRKAQRAEGPATVMAIGTATPPNCVDQSEYPDFYFRITNSEHKVELKEKFKRMCEKSMIKKRYMYLTEEILKENPHVCEYMAPSLDTRQDMVVVEVPKLGKEAATKAIKEWGQPKSKITHLIFCTTSGVDMPGADYQLTKLLGLRPSIKRFMMYQQGCFAGGTVLRMAKDLAENNMGARVLVVCSEITAVTFRGPNDTHLDSLVGQALFGDGSAAVIVGSDPIVGVEKPLFELVSAAQTILPDSDGAIDGHLREVGLTFHLLKDVPPRRCRTCICCSGKAFFFSTMSDLQTPLQPRPKRKKIWVDYFVNFRWIIIIFVVLPISFTLYFLTYLGDVRSEMKSYKQRQKEHDENVKKVVKRLKKRNPSKDGLVCTARKPWIAVGMRNVDYKRARHFEVDLSEFRNILEINKERMIARVEPLVNMGQITRASVPMNLALAVVAELDDLTVGGLINGYGIEGSSHIYGLFSDTVVAYEIVLADGQVVRATKDNEYSDLFYAIPWSQGTLGLLVSAEIKLIPIKEYMKLTYTPVKGNLQDLAKGYVDSFAPRDGDQDNPEKVPDFVETMIYNDKEGVCMTGRYASKQEAKKKGNVINCVGWWFKPWFYQHAQTALKRGEFVEYIPTREYYHRHTRCLYWEGKLILPFGDQWWFRFLFGWLMPPKVSLLKATQGEAIRNYYHEMHVIQDMLVPLYKVGDALEWVHKEMEVYPIWLCPHRLYKLPVKTMVYPEPGFELHRRQGDTQYAQMYTDVGVYYAPGPVLRGEVFDGAEAVRRMESWLIENHGFQPQYAVSELNEKSFWRMFDAELYEQCRKKYRAVGTFMSVYYKSKKGRKTEKEVQEAEQAHLETAYAEADQPMD